MPSIKQAVQANVQRINAVGTRGANVSQGFSGAPSPNLPNRTVLPTRGSMPPNIILATDFENSTGVYYGRLRARTYLSSSPKLLGNNSR